MMQWKKKAGNLTNNMKIKIDFTLWSITINPPPPPRAPKMWAIVSTPLINSLKEAGFG